MTIPSVLRAAGPPLRRALASLTQALSAPTPLETDAFAGRDDDQIFQTHLTRERRRRESDPADEARPHDRLTF